MINELPGTASDGYHTFDELYEHRHRLFIALAMSHPELSWKSRLHDDGTYMQGWFIAGMELPSGMITYHLPDRLWTDLAVHEEAMARLWDGHTPDDVVQRLRDWEILPKNGSFSTKETGE